MTTRHCPDDESKAHGRDGIDEELKPQVPRRNRLVEDARRQGQRHEYQDDGTPALGDRRPAKERPPNDDRQRGNETAKYRHQAGQRLAAHQRRPQPDQRPHDRRHYARPQPYLRPGHTRPDASDTWFVPAYWRDPPHPRSCPRESPRRRKRQGDPRRGFSRTRCCAGSSVCPSG